MHGGRRKCSILTTSRIAEHQQLETDTRDRSTNSYQSGASAQCPLLLGAQKCRVGGNALIAFPPTRLIIGANCYCFLVVLFFPVLGFTAFLVLLLVSSYVTASASLYGYSRTVSWSV